MSEPVDKLKISRVRRVPADSSTPASQQFRAMVEAQRRRLSSRGLTLRAVN